MEKIIKNTDRILIVSPHPDDESIGCGGIISKYGPQCDILLLTDGRKGYDSRDTVDEVELVAIREKELLQVAKIAGINQVYMLHIPDGNVRKCRKKIMEFSIKEYEVVFVPNKYEYHKDHADVSRIFDLMRRKQRAVCELFEYEVWSPLSKPMYYLDISSCIDKKIHYVSQYTSQIKYFDYVKLTVGLSQYRGASIKTQYAEVFSKVAKENIARKIYYKLPNCIRKGIHNAYVFVRRK